MANDWFQDAIEQTKEASLPFRDKAGAVAYYQRDYPRLGKGGWKQRLAHDLQPFTVSTKNPEGMKVKNLEKRFDSGAKQGKQPRLNNPEVKNTEQYKELARSLEVSVAPKNGYHVHFDGEVMFSPPNCEPRTFDVDITDDLADQVAADPGSVMDIALLVYMQQEEEEEASASICPNSQPKITVTANADDYVPPSVKRHKPAVPFMKRR